MLGGSRETALKTSFGNAIALFHNRARLFLSCWQKSFRCWEGGALHPLFAPSTNRSQSPAWSMPHRASLPECGAFPHVRILRPACWAISLRARPRELVRSFLVPAWSPPTLSVTMQLCWKASTIFCRDLPWSPYRINKRKPDQLVKRFTSSSHTSYGCCL